MTAGYASRGRDAFLGRTRRRRQRYLQRRDRWQCRDADVAIGGASATLTIRFENVVGLSAENLGLSAKIGRPLAGFASRLASGVSLPAALPLVVKISPPARAGSVSAASSRSSCTRTTCNSRSARRSALFSAPDGGTFTDITTASPAAASAPAAASRTSPNSSSRRTSVRWQRHPVEVLEARVAAQPARRHHGRQLHSELSSLYNASQNAYTGGNLVAAIEYLEAFNDAVVAASGSGLPDVWRSSRDLTNVAGLLRSASATLRYSLTLASNA